MRRKQIEFCVYNKSGCEPDGEHFCHFTLKCSGCRPTNISQKLQKGREIYDFTAFSGGDGGIRTLDLTDANRTLSQLSYAPMCLFTFSTGPVQRTACAPN